jgi:hypothetical protein
MRRRARRARALHDRDGRNGASALHSGTSFVVEVVFVATGHSQLGQFVRISRERGSERA